jgi:hypothetical protein
MIRFFVTGLIAGALLLGAGAANADAPQAGGHDWFPHFFEMCKEKGTPDADCQKRYDERKAQIIEICKKEGINGEEDCRKWVVQKRDEQMQTMRAICKENKVTGDEACRKWFEDRRAEFVANFQAQCQKDGLTPEQCQTRFADNVKKTQGENQKFVADCQAQGGTKEICMDKLRQMRKANAQKDSGPGGDTGGTAPAGGDPKGSPSSEKGKALPPPQ